MTEKERREIWDKKYCVNRGFTEKEKKEYGELIVIGGNFETHDDIKYQERLYDFITSLISNDNIDYISKLDKLKTFFDTNKSLKLFSNERWEF